MKIAIVLDNRTTNKDGRHPVKFRFTVGSRAIYSATDMFAFEHEFSSQSLFVGKDRHFRRMNDILSSELDRAEQLLVDLKRKGSANDPIKFKELFLNKKPTFNQYFKSFIDTKAGRTKEIYQATLNKINLLSGDIDFEDVTFSYLQSLDQSMLREGLKTNARGIHFRNIRAVFNQAINEDIASLAAYPFRKFKIKKEATLKRSTTVDKLKILFGYKLEKTAKQTPECRRKMTPAIRSKMPPFCRFKLPP